MLTYELLVALYEDERSSPLQYSLVRISRSSAEKRDELVSSNGKCIPICGSAPTRCDCGIRAYILHHADRLFVSDGPSLEQIKRHTMPVYSQPSLLRPTAHCRPANASRASAYLSASLIIQRTPAYLGDQRTYSSDLGRTAHLHHQQAHQNLKVPLRLCFPLCLVETGGESYAREVEHQ